MEILYRDSAIEYLNKNNNILCEKYHKSELECAYFTK